GRNGQWATISASRSPRVDAGRITWRPKEVDERREQEATSTQRDDKNATRTCEAGPRGGRGSKEGKNNATIHSNCSQSGHAARRDDHHRLGHRRPVPGQRAAERAAGRRGPGLLYRSRRRHRRCREYDPERHFLVHDAEEQTRARPQWRSGGAGLLRDRRELLVTRTGRSPEGSKICRTCGAAEARLLRRPIREARGDWRSVALVILMLVSA